MTKKVASKEPKSEVKKPSAPYTMDKKADGTITLTITVKAPEVEKVRKTIIDELVQHVELPGFRKGKAPRNVAEAKLAPERIREETLKKIITDEYIKAVKQFDIKPIINPLIHVENWGDGGDLVFMADTCEEPEATLGKYKDAVSKITAGSKIIVPGKEQEKPSLEKILEAAMTEVKITIPKVLIDSEASRLLSRLLDEVKTLGMTLDQYLNSKGITSEQIRADYEKRAEQDLRLEFFLRKVSDAEKITVEPKDIEEALGSIDDKKQQAEIAQNPYLVASIIRQQKTLDFLSKI